MDAPFYNTGQYSGAMCVIPCRQIAVSHQHQVVRI